MTKAELRTIYKAKRQALSADELAQMSEQILRQFQEYMDTSKDAILTHIHVFLPIRQQKEVDTWPIIHWIWEYYPLITVVASISNVETGTLTHFALTPQTKLLFNQYGIPEPEPDTSVPVPVSVIDMVLVPLLIVDRQGHRVGYGKGFYDRFLAECRPDCLKVGLSLFEPVECIPDIIDSDISLNIGITSSQVHSFL